ncbi:MarR family winged helix-turn-helix transcriptional regulator [Kosakonia cowanii]|jgi:DNA-binding MarR family transcriptional regulator|uniref:MarR family protein n=1 Tax=Enterobacter cloacae S611 TaxID=1399146 RepID=A0ABN0Q338_ENTCL|nr:MarR family transcriptional regulator [Kosakonia cowanii]ESS56365.1 marR family protein [Enterobacter cloacae S611]
MCIDANNDSDENNDLPAPGNAPVTVDQFLCFALYSASLAMTRLYQSRLKPLGLTYPQYLVLLALWEKDNVTVSEVGARVQLDSGTLSQLLKRLEASGLVARNRDTQGDERRVLITLTEQGQQLKIDAAGVPADMISVMDTPFAELSDLATRVSALREKLLKALP